MGLSGIDLRGVVESTQLGNKVSRILGRIDSQCAWNHQQCTRKFGNGQLLARILS